MDNVAFGKTMENVRKYRQFKLVITNRRRNYLVSELNYHTTNFFSAIEMKKKKVKMNRPVYLVLSILEISKTLMNEFWYDYIKPKYQYNAKLCYMDTNSLSFALKVKMFIKILQMVLKKDLVHHIMKLILDYQKVKIKKSLMK